MKQKFTIIILAMAIIGGGLATQANAITFTFQENGSNMDLGPTSTFTEGGFSLTASAFLTTGATTDLYAKDLGAGEIGLGTTSDPSTEHEIVTTNFIQLTLPTVPPSSFDMILSGSVSGGEEELVYFTTTPGTLIGATLIGTLNGVNGSVIVPAGDQVGFIDITAGSGNVLLSSATISAVPEPGSVTLLGIALAGTVIESLRRTLRARKASK